MQKNCNAYIQMSAQLFNIGVNIFIIISGICFGLQGKIKNNETWYRKRLRRIFIPYEMFLLILASTYMITGRSFQAEKWISCIFGMQGANVGVLGADHTWFLTVILICYLITPLLSKIFCNAGEDRKKCLWMLVASGIMPAVLAYVPWIAFDTIGANVCFYIIAYWVGAELKNGFQFRKKYLWLYIIVILSAFVVRFGGRLLWDNTRFYNCIIVGYTQYIAAFGMLGVFAVIFAEKKSSKIIEWLCQISFEIYLYHYMFIVGPVSLMHTTNSWVISSVIVLSVTVVVAAGMHTVQKIINRKK